jgi:hypothetical protein
MGTQKSSFIGFLRVWPCFSLLWVGLASGKASAQSAEVCGPAPAVKAALDQLPEQTPAQTDWQFHEQHAAALQALLRQYPDDVFVQRAYIDSMGGRSDRDKVIAEYKARYEGSPDNAQLAYLYGLTLVGRRSPEAIKLFSAALKENPRFLLPHLPLVTIYYNSSAFLNKEQGAAHLRAFLDACPASLEGYEALARMDDKDLLRPYTAPLRTMLASRSDPEAVAAYRTLWSLEFKAHPASDYDALRRQVAQDVERLRQLKLEDKRQWYDALQEGYKLVNDQKQSDWAQEQAQTRFPRPYELAAMTKWAKDHHWPDEDATPAVKQAFYHDLLQQSAQWIKERPNSFNMWYYWLDAVEALEDVPAADVKAGVDQALKVALNNAGPDGPSSDVYSEPAEILSQKHLEPEREVEWAQKGLAQWEIESKAPPDDFSDKEDLANFKYNQDYTRLQMLEFEVDGYLQLKQADKAQIALTQMDEWLQDLKSQVGDIQRHKKSYTRRLSAYWAQMAREAELRGRKLDAMGFYENALLARLATEEKPEPGKKDELADSARQLWANLGGTDEGWRLWYGRRADALANQSGLTWEDANLPLPTFELADLSGKTWNVASLKGKVTFLNFWASW